MLISGFGFRMLDEKRVEIVNKLCSNGFKVLLFTSNRHNSMLIHVKKTDIWGQTNVGIYKDPQMHM